MPPHPVDAPRETYVPILTYHQVADDGVQPLNPHFARDYTHRSDFVAQVQWLAAEGFTAVTHAAVYAWLSGRESLPERPVMLTFDDGRLNVLENAFPVLQALGWPATVYVITALADGQRARGHPLEVPSLTWEHLKVLRDAGWTIGSHTRQHAWLNGLPANGLPPGVRRDARGLEEFLLDELQRSRDDIQTHLALTPECFAYPGGQWNRRVERLVAQVYRSARLWNWRGPAAYGTRQTSPYRLPAMNISTHWSLADFQRLVRRSQPSYAYQAGLDWSGQPRGDVLQRARRFLGRTLRRGFTPSSHINEKTHV